ncbi:MAG: M48 family peptidase, partial [Candidatus Omnitrophota bacterium]
MIVHNYYLLAVLAILIGGYIVNFIIEKLDISHASPLLPREFEGYYDAVKYRDSQGYHKKQVQFSLAEDAFFTCGIIISILAGWFNQVDVCVRS